MISRTQWTVAAALAIAAHVGIFGFAPFEDELAQEQSAGRPGAVWGLPYETIADTVDPQETAEAPADASEAVEAEPTETEVTEAAETEPTEPVETETTETAEAEQPTPEPVTPDSPAEPVEAEAQPTPEAETVETQAASEAEPVESTEAVAVETWEGGVAVSEPVSQAASPVTEAEEVQTAMLTPPVEAEALEAEDFVPVPRLRPADVPRVEAPPPPKATTQPKPKTAAKPKPAAPSPTTGTRPSQQSGARVSAAPAGEQVGSSGQRQADAGRKLLSSYAGRVAAHLQRYKRYPNEAARERLSGTAVVTFTLGADGRVRGAKLARSSGQRVFDSEVQAMVSRASPFPPIPRDTGKSSYTFTVPVHFRPR